MSHYDISVLVLTEYIIERFFKDSFKTSFSGTISSQSCQSFFIMQARYNFMRIFWYIFAKLKFCDRRSLPDNQSSSQNLGDASNVAVSAKDSAAVINSRESSQPNVVITLILDEQKHNRKRYETQVCTKGAKHVIENNFK